MKKKFLKIFEHNFTDKGKTNKNSQLVFTLYLFLGNNLSSCGQLTISFVEFPVIFVKHMEMIYIHQVPRCKIR